MDPNVEQALIENEVNDESAPLLSEYSNISPEMREIMQEENKHFTFKRFLHILVCFVALMTTQIVYGGKAVKST